MLSGWPPRMSDGSGGTSAPLPPPLPHLFPEGSWSSGTPEWGVAHPSRSSLGQAAGTPSQPWPGSQASQLTVKEQATDGSHSQAGANAQDTGTFSF